MSAAARRPPIVDTSVPIVVLRTDPFHHGALAIARSAGRLGIAVYGDVGSRWFPAAWSRYLRRGLEGTAGTDPQELAGKLLALGSRLGRAILVPTDDTSALFVAENADALRERFTFPVQDPALVRMLSDKRELYRLCTEHRLPAARTVFPASRDEVAVDAEALGYPVVLKRIAAWHASRDPAAPSVFIAHHATELLQAYDAMGSPHVANVMLQEYIPGSSDSVWMFNGYFDERSECLAAFTGPKLRQRGPYTGPTTLGAYVPNETVKRMTTQLMKAVGYHGILDLGYRFDARDGQYKLLDVNPRIGGTFRLFVAGDGLDVLRAMYLDLTRQPVPPPVPSGTRKWIDEAFDPFSALQLGLARQLTAREWLRSLRDVREGAWFAADDPLPFLAMCVRMPTYIARRLAQRSVRAPVTHPLLSLSNPAVRSHDDRFSGNEGEGDRRAPTRAQAARR